MADNNIRHVFSMDEERFVSFLGELQALQTPAGYVLGELNQRIKDANAAQRDVRRALLLMLPAVLLLSGLLLVQGPSWFRLLMVLAFALATVSAIGIGLRGWRRLRGVTDTRRLAIDQRNQLEGEVGFLWRFEQFLQDWDHNLPGAVRNTLPDVCAASKAGILEDSLEALRAYWYWAAECEGRMNVAKAELRW